MAAIGGVIVLNDLRSAVEAKIVNANVEAADLDMDAVENAIIKATTDSSVESSGGSAFSGGGDSLAVNGTIATNVVISSAAAFVDNSTVKTTVGNVDIDAANTSTIDAKTLNSTTTGAQGVGVTLAFNTLGWQSQNILFNTIDLILGDPLGTSVSAVFSQVSSGRVRISSISRRTSVIR